MTKTLFYTALLFALSGTAQNFEWQWAKRGGGTKQMPIETPSGFGFELAQIVDIAVDADNNCCFLAFIGQQHTEFDGTPITVYNADNLNFSMTDAFIISTDCEGSLRWTQTIGGADRDFAYKLVLDNNGGLYLGANIMNISGAFPNHNVPTLTKVQNDLMTTDFFIAKFADRACGSGLKQHNSKATRLDCIRTLRQGLSMSIPKSRLLVTKLQAFWGKSC